MVSGGVLVHSADFRRFWRVGTVFGASLTSLLLAGWLPASPAGAAADDVVRISVANDGTQANAASSRAMISRDAPYVVFSSRATNLVPGDKSGLGVFRYDLVLRRIERVSNSVSGADSRGSSTFPVISGDGRFVAFSSDATDIVENDVNGERDVFIRDMVAGVTTRVSVAADGGEANGFSARPVISDDGRYVAFNSAANNLVAGDPIGSGDAARNIFVRDMALGVTSLVSKNPVTGAHGNGNSVRPVMSADGRYIAFVSDASNLVAGDTNGKGDILRYDRVENTMARVSQNSSGGAANGSSTRPSMSADGRFIGFQSKSRDLTKVKEADLIMDVYVRDMQQPDPSLATVRASVSTDGASGDGETTRAAVSGDGLSVAFASNATNLVADDDNDRRDVFIRDLVNGTTRRVSVDAAGNEAACPGPSVPGEDREGASNMSTRPNVDGTGQRVVFVSGFCTLVAGDTNQVDDIFVRIYG